MKYGLLLDIEVIDFLNALPMRVRRLVCLRLRAIQTAPDAYAAFTEYDRAGRRVDVHLYAGFAISYWDDFADRQVKVLRIEHAGR